MTNPYLDTEPARLSLRVVQTLVSDSDHYLVFRQLYPNRNTQSILLGILFKHFCDELRKLNLTGPADITTCLPIILRLTNSCPELPADRGVERRGTKAIAKGAPGRKTVPDDKTGQSAT